MRRYLLLLVYDILMPIFLVIGAPRYMFKNYRRGGSIGDILERLGLWRKESKLKTKMLESRPFWVHAVSVGEVGVALRLIAEIRKNEPQRPIVLTTTTVTAQKIARQKAPDSIIVMYHPLDLPHANAIAIWRIKPKHYILVESELWPDMLSLLDRAGVPISVVNARLSDHTQARYKKFGWIAEPFLKLISQVGAVYPEDEKKFVEVGFDPLKIKTIGSLKYDPEYASPEPAGADVQEAFVEFSNYGSAGAAPKKRFTIVGGSTHDGEELMLVQAYNTLREMNPDWLLQLIIAPRHVERTGSICQSLERLKVSPSLRSELKNNEQNEREIEEKIMVLDTTGELAQWYQLADLVVIGKSFLAKGGQNPVEALLANTAVVCGPNMQNFQPITEQLIEKQAIFPTKDNSLEALVETINYLIDAQDARKASLVAAKEVLKPHFRATRRTVEMLRNVDKS